MSLLTDLISYWKLDEASGNALDAHGSNDLTETGGTIGTAAGKVGNARDFEAVDTEWFELADNAELSTGDIDFTIALWVNFESLASTAVLVSKGTDVASTSFGTLDYCIFYSTTSSRFIFRVLSSGGTQGTATANNFGVASTGTWYFVVGWHDSVNNQVGISVNAGTPDTTAHTLGCSDSTVKFMMGADGTGRYLDGLLDEVGFWKRVLTAAERAELYNYSMGLAYSRFNLPTNTTGLYQSLLSYYKLDEASGNALDAHNVYDLLQSTSAPGTAAGKLGQARDFEAADADQFFRVLADSPFDVGDVDFTIAGWFNLESKSAVMDMVAAWDGTDGYLLLYNNSTDRFEWYCRNAGNTGVVSATNFGSPSTGTWYFIVMWHDSTNNQVGISVNNGTPNTVSYSNGIGPISGTSRFQLSSRDGSTNRYDGLMENVGFWKGRVLSSDDRTALWNDGYGLGYRAFANAPLPTADLYEDLVAYWKLDESSGDALDAHNIHDLADTNGVGTGTGKLNGARDFEASSTQRLVRASSDNFRLGNIPLTLTCWFKLESAVTSVLLRKAASGGTTREYVLWYSDSDDKIKWEVGNGTTTTTVSADNAGAITSTSNWYFVVVWHDPDTDQIGVAVYGAASSTANTAAFSSSGVLAGNGDFIMGADNTSIPFDGLIDEVGFWKRVLTSDERARLYNSGAGLAYEDFEESAVTAGGGNLHGVFKKELRSRARRPRLFAPGVPR